MTTFNGTHENLKFRCASCIFKETIEIDLDNPKDKEELWVWLRKHSASGGDYVNVIANYDKIPLDKRSDEQHLRLIDEYGGVRNYLLSIGAFKK